MILALSVLLPGSYTSPIPAAAAEPIRLQGPARVLDGDTLVVSRGLPITPLHDFFPSRINLVAFMQVAGEKVRLFGLDAPEKAQLCLDQNGKGYPCGAHERLQLRRTLHGVMSFLDGAFTSHREGSREGAGGEDRAQHGEL